MSKLLVVIGLLSLALYIVAHKWVTVSGELQVAINASEQKDSELKRLEELEAANSELRARYAETKAEVVYVDKEVIREVVKYRESAVPKCTLDPIWVHTYNLSAAGLQDGESTAGADGTAEAVEKVIDDGEALEVATENNRLCVAQAEKFRALQAWATQNQCR